jgi:tRNA-specific 2-thiouridylase
MNRAKIRVAVGLSGGVDSAVSALLLKKAGHEVVGVHLYCWPPKEEYLVSSSKSLTKEEIERLRSGWIQKNGCRADEDKKMALKTALELGIPFQTLDFSEEYNRRVVDYFYREYEAGRTPNPDVLCNSEIKFGLFLDWAIANGFDYVATGHYTALKNSKTQKLENSKQGVKTQELKLKIPKDKHKDQTYFLWKLTQKELKHVLFPLGDLEKSEVRRIAEEAGLFVAKRKDSQGICFVGNVQAREFLSRRLKEKKGEVKNTKGEVIGTHVGVWFYTIGQRGGWKMDPHFQKLENSKLKKLKTLPGGDMTPVYYVICKNAKKNELVVGIGEETKSSKFSLSEENWLGEKADIAFVRIRHGGKLIPATLLNNGVTLVEPQRGIAPGQSAVFYSPQGEMLGGGVIC